MTPKLYLVGGTVRDHFLKRPSSDYDFAVEAESYERMIDFLLSHDVHIWQERPHFVTARGKFPPHGFGSFGGMLLDVPRDHPINADFTLCRAEMMYSDGRHPDSVTPADILTDLSRRDFTMNAIAVSEDGEIIDPYDGRGALSRRCLVSVLDPEDSFEKDSLRMIRALRFMVIHDMYADFDLSEALSGSLVTKLDNLPVERVRDELYKMFKHDWRRSVNLLTFDYPMLGQHIFDLFPSLWLKPTTEAR